jgi:hypothetical protein
MSLLQQIKKEVREEGTRLYKKSVIGGDGFNFELAIDGASEGAYLDKTPLKNSKGKEFGEVEVEKGKIHISIILPKFVRENNITPFSVTDIVMLEVLKNDAVKALNQVLKGIIDDKTDVLNATATSVECNITKWTAGDSTCSQVLNLINRAFHEGTNMLAQRASKTCKYDKENESLKIRKKNCYVLKCYDKSLEQRKTGNYIHDDLLRIEVVMQNRIHQKLFGGKSTIQDVLTEHGLMAIIKEYKRIFIEDVIDEHIKPCLSDVRDILFNSLVKTESQVKTIALHKELIMDVEIFHEALVRWYIHRGFSEERATRNADVSICRNREKYGFAKNAIDTLREFKEICN